MTARSIEQIDTDLAAVEAKLVPGFLANGVTSVETRLATLEAKAKTDGEKLVAWVKANWHVVAVVAIVAGLAFVAGRL